MDVLTLVHLTSWILLASSSVGLLVAYRAGVL